MSNTQQILGMMGNKPRVHLSYQVDTNGSQEIHELPMRLLVIGHFHGDNNKIPYNKRETVNISANSFNNILKHMNISLKVNFNYKGQKEETLLIKSFKDFSPNQIMHQTKAFNFDLQKKQNCEELLRHINNNSKLYKISENFFFKNLNPKENFNNKEYFCQLLEKVKKLIVIPKVSKGKEDKPPKKTPLHLQLSQIIHDFNRDIYAAITEILHNKNFQQCEGSWLNLKKLLGSVPTSNNLYINFLSASEEELIDDLNNSPSFESNHLFDLVYEKSFGVTGGIPFTYCIFAFNLTANSTHMQLLGRLSEIMACSHIPTIVGLDSKFLGLDSFKYLYDIKDLNFLLESSSMAAFKSLRESENMRYISLVGPRIMARAPYHESNNPADKLKYFSEKIDNDEEFLWTSGAWAYGIIVGESYLTSNWFSQTIGAENGGKIHNLPNYIYKDKSGNDIMQCPTEIAITDRKEKELSDAGLTMLCHCIGESWAVVYCAKSALKPKKYQDSHATANSEISTYFHYILNCSRFAQMLKCIMRYKVGSFAEKSEMEAFLNDFIMDYVISNPYPSTELKAEYPLKDAEIKVHSDPARPGYYFAEIKLEPHSHLNEIDVQLSLRAQKIPGEK